MMFNDRYGLTQAVISGRKTVTRRVVKDAWWPIYKIEAEEIKGDIIIPTSGGYDSRFLNYLVKDKSRIKAFSYGISCKQENSFEVKKAREVCRRLGINWKQIKLGDFHKYFDDWDKEFGVSTHAHGMYQIEFYKKMKRYIKKKDNVLSGIIGDAWAGSIPVKPISKETDLLILGYTHDMAANSKYSKLKDNSNLKRTFLRENKILVNNPRFQVVTSMRFKMILLSYLMKVPKIFELKAWSPFLDMDLALSMLSIDPKRRKNRIWQQEFFESVGLNLGDREFKGTKLNYLNHLAMERVPLKPLNVDLLSELVNADYVASINKTILKPKAYMRAIKTIYKQDNFPLLNSLLIALLKRVNLKDPILTAYSAYLTLKPIENVLYKRSNIRINY